MTEAKFTAQDYSALRARLDSLSEEDYKHFCEKLTPGARPVKGVRTGALQAIAKELSNGDWQGYVACAGVDSHEETKLLAMVIAGVNCPDAQRMELLSSFVPLIGDWEICDTLCSRLKCIKKQPDAYWEFLKAYAESKREFEIRFALISLMHYYLNDIYIDRVLEIYKNMRHDGYYVKMAVAWALSFCFIAYRDKTLALISTRSLDAFTQNKTIQKCRESYRVSEADKRLLIDYKI